ncbi:hypothetical protein OTERR_12900 [Oryzomicrobium terrae]|uniref:Uncharacterized protein n=1 Tax=Oryzomicrobium terrae TaxID=1735038 RepID=A0A5C1E759_9RHOO|nr:hypothetical protein [Oryzomicrobium terrae]QEL64766.1 hypothetical protein OTERR_12900 [Oryzomicrobium terrae]
MHFVSDTAVQVGNFIYHFDTTEDAISFRRCVEKGGEPNDCAEKFGCINTEDVTPPPPKVKTGMKL